MAHSCRSVEKITSPNIERSRSTPAMTLPANHAMPKTKSYKPKAVARFFRTTLATKREQQRILYRDSNAPERRARLRNRTVSRECKRRRQSGQCQRYHDGKPADSIEETAEERSGDCAGRHRGGKRDRDRRHAHHVVACEAKRDQREVHITRGEQCAAGGITPQRRPVDDCRCFDESARGRALFPPTTRPPASPTTTPPERSRFRIRSQYPPRATAKATMSGPAVAPTWSSASLMPKARPLPR